MFNKTEQHTNSKTGFLIFETACHLHKYELMVVSWNDKNKSRSKTQDTRFK